MTEELQKKMQELAELHADNFTIDLMRQNALISFVVGFIAAYAHLAPLVEWNDVRDRLPKVGQVVLLKNTNDDISTGYFSKGKFVIDLCDISDSKVEFWRQIEL